MDDVKLDGRVPIQALEVDPPPGVDKAAFSQAVGQATEAEVTKQMAAVEERFSVRARDAEAKANKDQTLACLNTYIAGNPGDDLASMQFRNGIQDLVLAVHAGSEKPFAEILGDAAKLQTARMQVIQEAGGDGSQVVPRGAATSDGESDGGFDMSRYMGALAASNSRSTARTWTSSRCPGPRSWSSLPSCSASSRRPRRPIRRSCPPWGRAAWPSRSR